MQENSHPNLLLTTPPTVFVSNDHIFLYLLPDGSVHGYDSNGGENFVLPGPERNINSRVTCLAISPALSLAVAGFENGSLQVYDLGERKTLTSSSKARPGRISQVVFVGDFDIVVFDEQLNLTMFTLSHTFFAWTLKEKPLSDFRTFVRYLGTPLVYEAVDGLPLKPNNQSVCRSQRFANYIGLALFNRMVVAEVKPAWRVVIDRPVDQPVLAFDCPDPDFLYVACASADELRVDRIVDGKVEDVFKKKLRGKDTPTVVAFLSGAFVMTVTKSGDATLYNFLAGTESTTKVDGTGLYSFGNNCLHVLSQKSLQTLFLMTFTDQIEAMKKENDVEGAVALCKKAMDGDPKATVGLPMNVSQRALVIENAISSLLTKWTMEKLKKKENPAAVADYLIQLSLDLHIEEWVARNALRLFKEADVVGVFIEHIIKADPMAQSFTYNSQFVSLALEFCQDLDMSEFLYALPSKIIDPTALLRYVLKVHNVKMAAHVYQERLNDPLSAMSVFYSIGEVVEAFRVLHCNLSEKAIFWLFACQGGTFPRLEKLVSDAPDLALEILTKIHEGKKPFSDEAFINALLGTFAAVSVPANHFLFKFVEKMILASKDVKLSNVAMKYLMSCVFTDVVAAPDNRETIVAWVLDGARTTKALKQSLLPLCDAYGFESAKQRIRNDLKLYAVMLQDVINQGKDDPFVWIEEHLCEESKADIETVIKANADRLIAKNFDRLLVIIDAHFPSLRADLIVSIRNNDVKCYYLYRLLIAYSGFESYLNDVAPFIAKHFPDEILQLLEKFATKDSVSLLPFFEESGFTECCAVLCERAHDYDNLLKFVRILIIYCCENNVDRISRCACAILKGKPECARKTFHKLVKCYLVPLTDVGKIQVICQSLRGVIESAMELITFEEIMDYCGRIFNPLGREKYEHILNQLLRGREFTAEQTKSIFDSLIKDLKNEEDDLAKLICSHCKLRLFVDGTGFVILKCGHALHGTPFCMKSYPNCSLCQA